MMDTAAIKEVCQRFINSQPTYTPKHSTGWLRKATPKPAPSWTLDTTTRCKYILKRLGEIPEGQIREIYIEPYTPKHMQNNGPRDEEIAATPGTILYTMAEGSSGTIDLWTKNDLEKYLDGLVIVGLIPSAEFLDNSSDHRMIASIGEVVDICNNYLQSKQMETFSCDQDGILRNRMDRFNTYEFIAPVKSQGPGIISLKNRHTNAVRAAFVTETDLIHCLETLFPPPSEGQRRRFRLEEAVKKVMVSEETQNKLRALLSETIANVTAIATGVNDSERIFYETKTSLQLALGNIRNDSVRNLGMQTDDDLWRAIDKLATQIKHAV